MTHSFNTELAERYGVEEAIILNSIEFWINTNADKPDSQRDGRTWMYNSAEAWKKLHPYWTTKQIRRILDSLVYNGAVITSQFGGTDRSTWFALSDEYKDNFPIGLRASSRKETSIFPFGQITNNYIYRSSFKPDERQSLPITGKLQFARDGSSVAGLAGI